MIKKIAWMWAALGALWVISTGFSCGPTLKDCQIQQDCASNAQCVQFRCQPLDSCSSDRDCLAPRTCINQLCTPPAKGCSTDSDCTAPRICQNQACVDPPKGCTKDSDCGAPRICQNLACVDPPKPGCQRDSDCTAPQVCDKQVCVPPPPPGCSTDSDCTAPQTCQNKKCIELPKPGCHTDSDCTPPQTCQNNVCANPPPSGCTRDSDCTPPMVCNLTNGAGTCTNPPPPSCQKDSDCTAPQTCQNNVCANPPPPSCQKDSDCTAPLTCQSGGCAPPITGSCRLKANPGSLYFSEQALGSSDTKSLLLNNEGTGVCQLDKITMTTAKGTSGTFALGAFTPQAVAAGASLKVEVTFSAKLASGNTSAALEIFSSNILIGTVSLTGYVKPDTSIPPTGWAAVHVDNGFNPTAFIAGCFWKDGSFEAIANSAFATGNFNIQYGTMMKTTDGGNNWTCTNCVSGQSWPRQTQYDLVDMDAAGMACQNGRGYAYGAYQIGSGSEPNAIFTRTDAAPTWKRITDKNNLLGYGTRQKSLYTLNNEWFLANSRIMASFAPDTQTGDFQMTAGSIRYYGSGGASPEILGFDLAHKVGLMVASVTVTSGGNFVTKPVLMLNTNDAKVPPGTTTADTVKHWPQTATLPCSSSCALRSGIVLGPTSILVGGVVYNSTGQTTMAFWRSDDLGKIWKQVYAKSTKDLSRVTFLRYDSKRIFAVLGELIAGGGSQIEGALLESNDDGQSFQEIPVTQIKGQTLTKMPGLHGLELSPDGKTLYVLGVGTILRWKP